MHSASLMSIILASASLALGSTFTVRSDPAPGDYLNATSCPGEVDLGGQSRYISPAPYTEVPVDGNVTVTFCTDNYWDKAPFRFYNVYVREFSTSAPSRNDDRLKEAATNIKVSSTSVSIPDIYYGDFTAKGYDLDKEHELVIAEHWERYQGDTVVDFFRAPIKLVAASGESSKKRAPAGVVMARDQ